MTMMQSAQDFMRTKLETLDPSTNVVEGVSRLLKFNISGAPVVDQDGQYLGVFSEKCSMNALTETVELASEVGMYIVRAREIMTCKLTTLSPDVDVFEAVDHLLSKRISGAPVVDRSGCFLGIFSEKTAMRVLLAAAYDQFPGTNVGAYMNIDRNRIMSENDSLLTLAHRFQETPYRRLPILTGDRLAGQISRRDVLRAEVRLAKEVMERLANGTADQRFEDSSTNASVGDYMDKEAKTIRPTADVVAIAQVFLSTPYRRLPVVDGSRLVGQISRRDLLDAAAAMLRPPTEKHHAEALYLSNSGGTLPPSIG